MDDKEMFMVVGFEVLACSIQRSPGQKPTDISCTETGKATKPQEVTKGAHNPPFPAFQDHLGSFNISTRLYCPSLLRV